MLGQHNRRALNAMLARVREWRQVLPDGGIYIKWEDCLEKLLGLTGKTVREISEEILRYSRSLLSTRSDSLNRYEKCNFLLSTSDLTRASMVTHGLSTGFHQICRLHIGAFTT